MLISGWLLCRPILTGEPCAFSHARGQNELLVWQRTLLDLGAIPWRVQPDPDLFVRYQNSWHGLWVDRINVRFAGEEGVEVMPAIARRLHRDTHRFSSSRCQQRR